jgi:Ca2+-binding RTX toxin-like protein
MRTSVVSKTLSRFVVGLGVVVLALGVVNPAQAAPKAKTSTGLPCTIVGTSANNTLTGTAAKDIICGLGGNDTIKGMGGNDIIDGGTGNDTVYGGDGNDIVYGGAGDDKLRGDAGNDSFYGDTGNDALTGGEGNDTLRGGVGNDSVTGDGGNDLAVGGDGNDTLNGGLGNDTLSGEVGNDRVIGGDGVDTLNGNDGIDSLSGDAGNDKVNGGAGDDNLNGGIGDDSLLGEVGNDAVTGGDGSDRIEGGDGNDSLTGSGGNDAINGGEGNDALGGGDGNDALSGGDGNDKIYGDAGNDALKGEGGNDGMIGGAGSDNLAGANGEPAPTERNLCEKDILDVVTYCGFDNAAPWVVSAELSTTSVDSSVSAQTIQVTMHVTDELMGVDVAGCSITLDGARSSTGYERAVRTSGDAIDGMYTCNVTIPLGGSTGRWGLNIDTRDRAGNMGFANQGPNRKWHSNLPEIMDQTPEHWIEQTGAGDNQSPRITNPVYSKTEIDTSAGPDSFNLDVTVTDDFSGIKSVNCGPRHNSVENFDIKVVVTKLSGTGTNGVWRCAVTLPQNSGQGKWTFSVVAVDNTGKIYAIQGKPLTESTWAVDDISEIFVQPALDLGVNYVTQIGEGDDQLPTMTSITLDKTQVNTSSSDQTVVATLNLVDLESGIRSAELRSFSPTTFAQNTTQCKVSTTDGAGNEVWTCTLKLPLGSQKGLHGFSIMMYDKVGNRVTYDYNKDTGKWRMRPLDFYGNIIPVENLELGPVGVLNTD